VPKNLAKFKFLHCCFAPLVPELSMSEEQLKLVASTTINGLFSSGKVSVPISSMDLLSRVISSGPPTGLMPTPPPRFRLTDLPKFESILESLSQNWDHGTIALAHDDGGVTVMDVHLGSPGSVNALAGLNTRKRKRVVDEDADSAAGNDDEQDSFEGLTVGSTTLGNLSKELKEVYTILQKSTAKGRLLAEQVC
jgi:mRNA m6A methyltransferase catalytic subunit